MNEIKNIAIYGSCITKFPFTTTYNPDYKKKYKCIINDQLHSFISTMQESEEYDEKDIILSPDTLFTRLVIKSIKQDLEKSFIKAIKNNKIDYLVFDVYYDVLCGIMQYDENKIISSMSLLDKTPLFKKFKNVKFLNMFIDPTVYFDLWKKYCDKFFKFMKDESPNTVLVLAEVRALDKFQKEDLTTYIESEYTKDINKLNIYLKKFEEYIKNTQDVHVIKFKENTLLNEYHEAGKLNVHYSDEYYTNFMNEFDKINQQVEKDKSSTTNTVKKYPREDIIQLKRNNKNLQSRLHKYKTELFKIRNELFIYNTVRIDLINWASNAGIELIEINDDDYILFNPDWLDKQEASGIIIESDKKHIEFKIKCIKDGLLRIYLRSTDARDKNMNLFPVFIDFEKLTINDSIIFDENKLVTCYHPYIFEKKVSNGEIISVKISWSPFSNKSEYDAKLYI